MVRWQQHGHTALRLLSRAKTKGNTLHEGLDVQSEHEALLYSRLGFDTTFVSELVEASTELDFVELHSKQSFVFWLSTTKMDTHGHGPGRSTNASIIMLAWCPSRNLRRISTYSVSVHWKTIPLCQRDLFRKSIFVKKSSKPSKFESA